MRILTALLILAFSFPLVGHTARAHPSLLDSVRPLSQIVSTDHTTRIQAYRNICTVSSINAALRLWLAVAHCAIDEIIHTDGSTTVAPITGLTIMGHLAFVVKIDTEIDLAILFVPGLSLPALRLASKGPFWEDEIRAVGYPFGYPDVTITAGTVSNPNSTLDSNPRFAPSYMLVTALVAPGSSGSPVVNSRGEIVSVLQIGWGRGYSPGGGATYARLKAFAGEYFER